MAVDVAVLIGALIEPVLTSDGTMLWGNGVPFLRAGRSVVGAPPEFPLRIDVDPEAGPKSAGGPEQLTRKRGR